jgi:Transposase DNA-binding/Transposase Tn5 dimerisation domain
LGKRKNRRTVSEAPDAEVQSIMEGVPECLDWVRHEFGGVDLGDERLNKRLIKTVRFLLGSPLSPINEACPTWADTHGAYRMLHNKRTEPREVQKPHIRSTANRIEEVTGYTLIVQDTCFLSYGQHPKTQGLGPIGKSNSEREHGLCMHTALAFTTSGVPLGILSHHLWAREEVSKEEHQEKIERVMDMRIDEKESFKWLQAHRETMARIGPRSRSKVVLVADREADIWELITEVKESEGHFLIRANYEDRKLVPEESDEHEVILEALAAAEVLGGMIVHIPSNWKRKARVAKIEVRATRVTLKAPQKRGRAKETASTEPMSVYVIQATEILAPEGETPIAWVLLTDLLVAGLAGASEKVDWYGKRWGIEVWHRVLKSGCAVEECRLETAERLQRYVSIFSIIAVRLMHVAYLARDLPEAPATEVFSWKDIETLHIRLKRELLPLQAKVPTLREVVRMIGSLGGHLGRKCDGEPGLMVIWRGWMRLFEDVVMLDAHRQALCH